MKNMDTMVKIRSVGDKPMMMSVSKALSWFADNGFKYSGKWADEKGKNYVIFKKGINIYQMIY